jgi:hypothetical protein
MATVRTFLNGTTHQSKSTNAEKEKNANKYGQFFDRKWKQSTWGTFKIAAYIVFGDETAGVYNCVVFEIVIDKNVQELYFKLQSYL